MQDYLGYVLVADDESRNHFKQYPFLNIIDTYIPSPDRPILVVGVSLLELYDLFGSIKLFNPPKSQMTIFVPNAVDDYSEFAYGVDSFVKKCVQFHLDKFKFHVANPYVENANYIGVEPTLSYIKGNTTIFLRRDYDIWVLDSRFITDMGVYDYIRTFAFPIRQIKNDFLVPDGYEICFYEFCY
jgi:hypothetical protein